METKSHELTRRRFTVHDYRRMDEAGILHEDDRVELIEGEIVEMAAIGNRHFSRVNRLTRLLVRGVGDDAIVSVQNLVRLNEDSEPRPDLAVPRPRDYLESLPGPEDVLFLIEVSDTTLAYDRNLELPPYARAGVAEVWIVNLASETVERHTEPSSDSYRRAQKAKRADTVASTTLPRLAVEVDAALC